MKKTVSIIIPNFNGKELLKANLPNLIEKVQAKELSSQVQEIIIVDDGSTDDSIEFIRKNFPQIKLISLNKNYGFAYASNVGIKEAKGEIVYLLNSDVRVCQNFLEPLVTHFNQEDAFAVSSAEVESQLSPDQLPKYIGIPLVKFKYGILWYWYQDICTSPLKEGVEAFCVSGGHTAYDREKFLSLGGFDIIFRPFYAEDGDICWRAWKRGWKSLFEPKSVVMHTPQSTISKFYAKKQILKIHWKNRILLTWKDITSPWLIFKHLIFLLPEVILLPILGRGEFTLGFFSSLKQFKELLKSRQRDKVIPEIYSDLELFYRFSSLRRLRPLVAPRGILYLHETGRFSGAEESLLNLARNLNKDKFRPLFVLPEEGKFTDALRQEGITVYLVEMPKIRRMKGIIKAISHLKQVAETEDIVLIHSNSIRTNIYGAIVAKLEKIPVVWHQRNLLTNEWIDPDRLLSFLADKIICNSQAIAHRFKMEIRRLKVKVIYNGIDTEKFNPSINNKVREEFGIKADEMVIGIASRFGPDKGHETFLKAARIITHRLSPITNCKFLIAGDAVFKEHRWREEYLKGMVERLGLSNRVIFTGFRDDMPQVYAAMDIFVLTSESEPCGRVLFEAMASGKPIVATNSGGTPEIVQDGINGYLVKPKDPQALADKLSLLLSNPGLAKAMAEENRKRAMENFNIKKHVEQTEKIYLELLYGK